MEAIFHIVELANGLDRITVGQAQMRHRVQRRTSHQHLRRLPSKLPRADAVPEDRLHPKHLRLGKTSAMIADFFLPLLAPDLPNPPQILIAYQPLLLRIPMSPNLRVLARRNRRFRSALTDGFIAITLVIR